MTNYTKALHTYVTLSRSRPGNISLGMETKENGQVVRFLSPALARALAKQLNDAADLAEKLKSQVKP